MVQINTNSLEDDALPHICAGDESGNTLSTGVVEIHRYQVSAGRTSDAAALLHLLSARLAMLLSTASLE